jgi:urease accessory protein
MNAKPDNLSQPGLIPRNPGARFRTILCVGFGMAWFVQPAMAHSVPSPQNSLLSGIAHPLGGLDHLLAMLAVGLWASQLGGRAIWQLPAAFLALMAVGGGIGIAGIALPGAEFMIVFSVLLLGVLIACAARFPLVSSLGVVAVFALFHGHAHGAEMGVSISAVGHGLGFTLASALLHLAGIGIGVASSRLGGRQWLRLAGCLIALCGLGILILN